MKIVGIDTNALLTFRLQREPNSNEVKRLFEQSLANKAKIYVPLPVILEVEWVLRSYYKQDKESILSFFDELLLLDNVLTDYKEDIKFALNLYKNSNKISFTDSIIVSIVKSKDYEFLTFDRELEKIYQSLL
jgi:predicted nucleic-acid-binding protein